MKLWVDDIRPAPGQEPEWVVAKNINQAIRAITRFDFEEISLDHDISHQVAVGELSRPYPCGECFCAVAFFIGEKYVDNRSAGCPKITIHTSNPIAKDEMLVILKMYGLSAQVKMQGMTNRLEMQME